jgi:hypothetical protein
VLKCKYTIIKRKAECCRKMKFWTAKLYWKERMSRISQKCEVLGSMAFLWSSKGIQLENFFKKVYMANCRI